MCLNKDKLSFLTDDNFKVLDAVINSLKTILPIKKVILFGSRARGDFTEDSDWDFAIILDDKWNQSRIKSGNIAKRTIRTNNPHIKVDIIAMFDKDFAVNYQIYNEIKKEGVMIYEQ